MTKNTKKSIIELEKNKIITLEQQYENISYLDDLNYEQKIVATRKDGNFLVIAGPGSGKTHTLIYRVLFMISHGNVLPSEICVITFTGKAAEELKFRINQLLPNVKLGFVGSFHALAAHLINLNGAKLKNYRLIDPSDDKMILKLMLEEENIQIGKSIKRSTILKIISYSKNTKLSIAETLIKLGYEEHSDKVELIENINNKYQQYKKINMYLNYDDILEVFTYKSELFKIEKENIFYKYVMIDEYQDTNNLQIDFIKALNIPNVMGIGDDFQSIYGFRGANHKIILNFYNDFTNSKMIILIKNYRSTPQIVQVVNQTIKEAKLGYKKQLIPVKPNGNKVSFDCDPYDYAQKIIANFKEHQEETNALIYRNSSMRNKVEEELIKQKLNYVVYGGVRLLERKHIKDILAFVLSVRNKNDGVSNLRVLTTIEGIGEKSAKRILIDKSFNYQNKKYVNDLNSVKNILASSQTNPTKLLQEIIDFYETLNKPKLESSYNPKVVKNDFNILIELANSYQDIKNFITDIILDPSINYQSNKTKKSNIVLTTIHSAKGLEFDNVHFLYGLSFNQRYDLDSIEEERRLFYVAISRAKNNLTIYDQTGLIRTIDEIINDFSLENNLANKFKTLDGQNFLSQENIIVEQEKNELKENTLIVQENKNSNEENENEAKTFDELVANDDNTIKAKVSFKNEKIIIILGWITLLFWIGFTLILIGTILIAFKAMKQHKSVGIWMLIFGFYTLGIWPFIYAIKNSK